MNSLSEKSLPRYLNELTLKTKIMSRQEGKNTDENQFALEKSNRDESAINQDSMQTTSNIQPKSDQLHAHVKKSQLPGKSKPLTTLTKKENDPEFTDHRDNSKLFEEAIRARLERFRTLLEKKHKVKATPFVIKTTFLSSCQVDVINQALKDFGLADIETKHGQKKSKPFVQEKHFEIDFLFVVEPALTQSDPAPQEIQEEILSNFIITLPVPSVVIFEITLDSTKEMMCKKIAQLARNALLIRTFPEAFFDYKCTFDQNTLQTKHTYGDYPLHLVLISNNDVVLGAHHFLEEYLQLAQHQSFINFMNKIAAIPNIKVTSRALDELVPVIEQQKDCGLRIGQLPVYSIYAQNLENFEKRLYSLEHRYQESIAKLNKTVADMEVKMDTNFAVMRTEMDTNFAAMRTENENFKKDIRIENEKSKEETKEELKIHLGKLLDEGLIKIQELLISALANKQVTTQTIIQTGLQGQAESQPTSVTIADVEQKVDTKTHEGELKKTLNN